MKQRLFESDQHYSSRMADLRSHLTAPPPTPPAPQPTIDPAVPPTPDPIIEEPAEMGTTISDTDPPLADETLEMYTTRVLAPLGVDVTTWLLATLDAPPKRWDDAALLLLEKWRQVALEDEKVSVPDTADTSQTDDKDGGSTK